MNIGRVLLNYTFKREAESFVFNGFIDAEKNSLVLILKGRLRRLIGFFDACA